MNSPRPEEAEREGATELLEKLILLAYPKVKEELEKNPPKLGEFLRMFELRLKAGPTSTRNKRFWQMLDEIRRKTLPAKEGNTKPPQPGKKKEDGR